MMPHCTVKGCREVAQINFGSVYVPDEDTPEGAMPHPEVMYVCKKHFIKLVKYLGYGHRLEGTVMFRKLRSKLGSKLFKLAAWVSPNKKGK